MERSSRPETLKVKEITFESLIQQMKGVSLGTGGKGMGGRMNSKAEQR